MANMVQNGASAGADFVVEMGGEFNSAYSTLTTALRAGLELKNKYSQAKIKVYDVTERPLADVAED